MATGLAVCFSLSVAYTQKIEVEKRIDRKDFPTEALSYITQEYPAAKKMKFYRQRSTDSLTYEAKLKQDGYRFSVEFSPEGQLLDVEKKVKFSSLPEHVQDRIISFWEQSLDKFKIDKCQEQSSDLGIRYEIEVKAKVNKEVAFYEYLFEANGTFIKKVKIILHPNDMTLY